LIPRRLIPVINARDANATSTFADGKIYEAAASEIAATEPTFPSMNAMPARNPQLLERYFFPKAYAPPALGETLDSCRILLAFSEATTPAIAIARNRYEPDNSEAGAKTTKTPAPNMEAAPSAEAPKRESLGLAGEE
jgi:hypothetical protein